MPLAPALTRPAPLAAEISGETTLGLPTSVIGGLLAFSLVGLATPNPLLTAASLAVLPFVIALPWRPGEPPILAFVVGFQWLQATAKVFHANVVGADVSDLILYVQYGQFTNVEAASWLSLIGVLILAVGARLAIHTMDRPDRASLLRRAEAFSLPRMFWAYIIITFGVTALYGTVGRMSGFRQILASVVHLKWAAYFLVGYLVLVRREGYSYLAAAFGIEFISGIGFFSGFKEVLFMTVVTFFAARSRVTVATAAGGAAVLVALVVVGSAWQVVKPDFRRIISGGDESTQGAVIDQGAQVALLYDLVASLDREDIVAGFEPLAERLTYVDFFGYTLEYVPDVIPHEGGAQWGAAVRHILTPRIFFPDKPPIISDSEVTRRYTGLYVAGEESGTSISLGYMGESYVDFGPYFMFVPVFLIGLWRGLMYRFFVRREDLRLVGYAFTVGLFVSTYQLEVATGKLLGGVLMRFIVLALLFRLVVPRMVSWFRTAESREDMGNVPDTLPVRRTWA